MPKSLMIAGSGSPATYNRVGVGDETMYFACANTAFRFEATQVKTKIKYRSAGVISKAKMVCVFFGFSDSAIFTLQVNGTDTSITITVTSDGTFTDDTHTATIAAGDYVNWKMVSPADDTGLAIQMTQASVLFNSTTDTVVRHAAVNFAQQSNVNVTYMALSDNCSVLNTTLNYADFKCAAAGVIRNLFCYVSQWTNTTAFTSTIDLMVNGSAVGSFTKALGAVNEYELTGVDATINAGDTVCLRHTTAGTGSITLEIASVEWVSTARQFHMIYGDTGSGCTATAAEDLWLPGGGGGAVTQAVVESSCRLPLGLVAHVSKLTAYISADTIDSLPGFSDGTPFYLRKDGVNGQVTFTVPELSPPGRFTSADGLLNSFAAATELSYFESGVGLHGSITWRHIGCLVSVAALADINGVPLEDVSSFDTHPPTDWDTFGEIDMFS